MNILRNGPSGLPSKVSRAKHVMAAQNVLCFTLSILRKEISRANCCRKRRKRVSRTNYRREYRKYDSRAIFENAENKSYALVVKSLPKASRNRPMGVPNKISLVRSFNGDRSKFLSRSKFSALLGRFRTIEKEFGLQIVIGNVERTLEFKLLYFGPKKNR